MLAKIEKFAEKLAGKSLTVSQILEIWNSMSSDTCKHVFKRGAKEGSQCETKVRNGSEYCSIHAKANHKSPPIPKKSNEINGQVVLHKHKILGKLFHAESLMVFESAENKVVIGKLDPKQQRVIPLTNSDKETCKKLRFLFKENVPVIEDEDVPVTEDEEVPVIEDENVPVIEDENVPVIEDEEVAVNYPKLIAKALGLTRAPK